MTNDKISIIIPVFNSEKFLDRCLSSVCAQTLHNIEFIIIDNGSTDRSYEICSRYAENDPRIRVIQKEHGGVASARNLGLDNAKGNYIGFIDSDDDILPQMYEKMYNLLKENNADICICNAFNAKEINAQINSGIIVLEHHQFILDILENRISSHLWNKLFKAELFKDLRIPEDDIAGDLSVMHILFDRADKIVSTDEMLYNYYINPNSVTTNPINLIKNKYDRAVSFEKRYVYAIENYKHESILLARLFVSFYARTYALLLSSDKNYDINKDKIRDKILIYKKYWKKSGCLKFADRFLCFLIILKQDKVIKIFTKKYLK